jgi:23S rRNA pseudouridine1911/1915/1917 synthase
VERQPSLARRGVVAPGGEGPLDRAVRELFEVSWGRARAWIAAGKVRVGETVVTDETSRVRAGDAIQLDERAPRQRGVDLADDQVVFVDAQVVVVAKPAGVSTVPYDASETGTLDARVRSWLARRGLAPRGVRPSLGVVHRIDKETTGLVVFTRTWLAKQSLTGQFRAHSVHRRYLAIAHGDVRSAVLRSLLVGNRGDGLRGSASVARKRAVARAPEGTTDAREAVTHVERIEGLQGATLVGCRLETGRTHQIRVQLSEAGHPLVGERVYVRDAPGERLDAPRVMLHAAELGFVHPVTERPMRWEQAMPGDMREVLERLRRR